jgi:hypothetical protein
MIMMSALERPGGGSGAGVVFWIVAPQPPSSAAETPTAPATVRPRRV